jgi:hypothetical protein
MDGKGQEDLVDAGTGPARDLPVLLTDGGTYRLRSRVLHPTPTWPRNGFGPGCPTRPCRTMWRLWPGQGDERHSGGMSA